MNKKEKYTAEQKQEIIAYVVANGYKKVREQYGVWPDTVKYWIDPEHKKIAKERSQQSYNTVKDDPAYRQKANEYQKQRTATGVTQARRKEWLDNLPDNQKQAVMNNVKRHRLDNAEHYKEMARQRYLKAKAKKQAAETIVVNL